MMFLRKHCEMFVFETKAHIRKVLRISFDKNYELKKSRSRRDCSAVFIFI